MDRWPNPASHERKQAARADSSPSGVAWTSCNRDKNARPYRSATAVGATWPGGVLSGFALGWSRGLFIAHSLRIDAARTHRTARLVGVAIAVVVQPVARLLKRRSRFARVALAVGGFATTQADSTDREYALIDSTVAVVIETIADLLRIRITHRVVGSAISAHRCEPGLDTTLDRQTILALLGAVETVIVGVGIQGETFRVLVDLIIAVIVFLVAPLRGVWILLLVEVVAILRVDHRAHGRGSPEAPQLARIRITKAISIEIAKENAFVATEYALKHRLIREVTIAISVAVRDHTRKLKTNGARLLRGHPLDRKKTLIVIGDRAGVSDAVARSTDAVGRQELTIRRTQVESKRLAIGARHAKAQRDGFARIEVIWRKLEVKRVVAPPVASGAPKGLNAVAASSRALGVKQKGDHDERTKNEHSAEAKAWGAGWKRKRCEKIATQARGRPIDGPSIRRGRRSMQDSSGVMQRSVEDRGAMCQRRHRVLNVVDSNTRRNR